ncbi:MAG: hypothetical protein HUU32_11380 [Calditrichaceae bacterium]|nr:hypothetical protein [Calditrichia bacterium]NUQ41989.1 hypothetical protein [Calditrichaceae bacterium]
MQKLALFISGMVLGIEDGVDFYRFEAEQFAGAGRNLLPDEFLDQANFSHDFKKLCASQLGIVFKLDFIYTSRGIK